jgi:hypothetical protein
MKTLLAATVAAILCASTSSAVTWDIVKLSVVVKTGNDTGKITTTVLTDRSYLNFVATDTTTAKNDLFVGFREDTGEVAVVKKSTETVLYNIISGLGAGGTASNGTGTQQSIAVSAVISSLNTDFTNGFVFDGVKRNDSGAVKSVTRLFLGGFQNQTIRGSMITTGKKVEL